MTMHILQIFKLPEFEEVASHQIEIAQICPKDGWVEQNPIEILTTVQLCVKEACGKLTGSGNFNKIAMDDGWHLMKSFNSRL